MPSIYTLYPNVSSKTVSSTAVAIFSASDQVTNFTVQNIGTQAVYIGNSQVTTTLGLKINADEMLTFPQLANRVQHKNDYDTNNYYVVCSSSNSTLIVSRDIIKNRGNANAIT